MQEYVRYLLNQIDLEVIACWSVLVALCVVVTWFGPTLHACLLWLSLALNLLDIALIAGRDCRQQRAIIARRAKRGAAPDERIRSRYSFSNHGAAVRAMPTIAVA